MKYRFLVTCATGDIGSELCLYLAKKGHDLILTARNLERLNHLSEKIMTTYSKSKVTVYAADLSKPKTMIELIDYVSGQGIDGIILMLPRPPVLLTDPMLQFHALNAAMQACFTGPRFLLQQLLPGLKNSSLKSVVLLSGASSKQPIIGAEWEAFNDIRTTWVGCLKTFADIYGSKGIRFNTVSPGQVVTPTYTKKLEEQAKATTKLFTEVLREKTAQAPLKELPSVSGVTKTIYFFLKSSGAKEITSTNTLIDGGASRPYY